MKKRGGSLDNQMLFYTVAVIAVLNLIAYLSVGDWRSILWFCVSGFCMFVLTSNQSISVLVAILGGALCRSIYVEGMGTDKKSDPKKPVHKKPDKSDPTKSDPTKPDPMEKKPDMMDLHGIKDIMNGANLEGLANKLANTNSTITEQIGALGPMMRQMNTLVDKLPEGFLAQAMKNFNQIQK